MVPSSSEWPSTLDWVLTRGSGSWALLHIELDHVGGKPHPGPNGSLAVCFREMPRPFVLLIDKQGENRGASVTNAARELVTYVYEIAYAPTTIAPQGIEWIELDSMGYFDRLHPTWRDEAVIGMAYAPLGNRGLAAYRAEYGRWGGHAWRLSLLCLPAPPLVVQP